MWNSARDRTLHSLDLSLLGLVRLWFIVTLSSPPFVRWPIALNVSKTLNINECTGGFWRRLFKGAEAGKGTDTVSQNIAWSEGKN